mmetsp:Transcript_57844/g.125779  ORF Transcript_57844/g.125779 Transcript_57844/m.125779 type:complete len:123 (+) Transcript_57844:773-1141(+)
MEDEPAELVPESVGNLQKFKDFEKEVGSGYDDMKLIQFSNKLENMRSMSKNKFVSEKDESYLEKLKELETLKKLRMAKLKKLDRNIDVLSKMANKEKSEKWTQKLKEVLNRKDYDEKELDTL